MKLHSRVYHPLDSNIKRLTLEVNLDPTIQSAREFFRSLYSQLCRPNAGRELHRYYVDMLWTFAPQLIYVCRIRALEPICLVPNELDISAKEPCRSNAVLAELAPWPQLNAGLSDVLT